MSVLKFFINEAKWANAALQVPLVGMRRRAAWPKDAPSGIRVAQKPERSSFFWFARNDLDLYQNASGTVGVIDIARSKGNYVVDIDGGASLDACTGDINPLGYNHDALKNLAIGKTSKSLDLGVLNMADAGSVASATFADDATDVLNKIKPEGLNGFTLVSSRSAAGDAVKDAMTQRAINTNEDKWCALRFTGSTHGSPLTLGGMICGWPSVAYPDSKASEA